MSTYTLICSLAISDDRLLKKLIFRLNFTKKSPHKGICYRDYPCGKRNSALSSLAKYSALCFIQDYKDKLKFVLLPFRIFFLCVLISLLN